MNSQINGQRLQNLNLDTRAHLINLEGLLVSMRSVVGGS
jgi:hypothetical protein